MKSRIARKLTLYFAASLLLFAGVIGVLFITLFRAQTLREHKNELEARAVSIAGALSDYMGGEATGGRGMMGGGMMGGYGAYLRFIDDIAMADVWIVDEQLNLINNGMAGQTYNYADLPQNAEQVVKEVFDGTTTFSEGFSGLLNAPTLTVGTPIEVDGQIIGAVLLHAPVEGMDEAAAQGVRILAVSILAALVLAAVLSIFLAFTFTKPLNKMKNSALLLAEGDYAVKTGVLQKDEIGELAGAIDVLSEKLQAAKEQSDQTDKLRRDFVANVSHELRTPVTVIRGSLEALCDGVITKPDQVGEYHRQMLKETVSLQRLVSDLLDLSKLQNPEFKMEMREVDVCDILHDVVRSASQIAKEKGVEVRLGMDIPSRVLRGDYGRLRQMLLVVLDNAVKFSHIGGVVQVRLEDGMVSIADQGSGIPEADLPHVFDRFYKVKSQSNENGSGLGLAIAKEIADRHGIRVSVISREQEGTRFEFRF